MKVTVGFGLVIALAAPALAEDAKPAAAKPDAPKADASKADAPKAEAAAGPPAFHIGPQATWIMLGGLTTGGTVALADKGYFIGGELSFAFLKEGDFLGVYTDAYYDWGASGTYLTGGIELGHKFISLDGGMALRFDSATRTGFAARVSVGLGVASAYLRYMHFPSNLGDMPIPNDDVIQVGIQLKLPLHTFEAN